MLKPQNVILIAISVAATLIGMKVVRDVTEPPPLTILCDFVADDGKIKTEEYAPSVDTKGIIACPGCRHKAVEMAEMSKRIETLARYLEIAITRNEIIQKVQQSPVGETFDTKN